jgi:transposase
VRVLARKTVRVKAFRLGEALDWAVAQARVKGFTQVAVACEPTGPRWLQVQRAVRRAGAAAGVHPAAGVAYRPGAAGLHDPQE